MPTENAKTAPSDLRLVNSIDESDGVCSVCFGSGMEIVAGKGARVCSCQRRTSNYSVLEKAKLPRRYLSCHFNSYRPTDRSQEIALRYAMNFTKDFPAVDGGILFSGPVGVGKTHLAVSILIGLSERGFRCLFYEFGSLLKEIQDSYNSNTRSSELAVLAPVFNADVLVLDELGSSKPTDWVRDTMTHIINTRYNDNKVTIFTTNYPDQRTKPAEETLEDRVDARVRSRLYEMCKTIEMKGNDYRRTKFER
jgi:DNA replication protein DnaC